LGDVLQGHEHEFHGGVGRRERLAISRDLPDCVVHRLDGIGRVDGFPDRFRELQEGDDLRPSGPPASSDHRVLLVPLLLEAIQGSNSRLLGRGGIHGFQIGGYRSPILVGYELQRVPDHMHDAELDLGLREHGVDGLGETGQAIDRSYQDVLDTAIV